MSDICCVCGRENCNPDVDAPVEDEQTLNQVLIGLVEAVDELVNEFQKMVAMQIVLVKLIEIAVSEDD